MMIPLHVGYIHISVTIHHKGKQLNLIIKYFARKSISRKLRIFNPYSIRYIASSNDHSLLQ